MGENAAAEVLSAVHARMNEACAVGGRKPGTAELVAVSKTFGSKHILPFLQAGQRRFGENRVQEAAAKWPELRQGFQDICLHLIGPLQTNKVRDAVALFDVIETLDREGLAEVLAKEIKRLAAEAGGRPRPARMAPKLYVQINTGEEAQKAGVPPQDAVAFVDHCRRSHGLTIDGLMCIPPAHQTPGPHFALLHKLAKQAGVSQLSMGMSGDFEEAIWLGATSVRVGSALFGARSLS